MFCCQPSGRQSLQPPARRRPDIDCAGQHRAAMSLIEAGSCQLGYDGPEVILADGEAPPRSVTYPAFAIDRTAVTNHDFSTFVRRTGYVTDAERAGGSFVFYAQVHPEAVRHVEPAAFGTPRWWLFVAGASWSRPEGPGSGTAARFDHPVVHVSWNDAQAYATWSGKRLPTEDEWEIAARGGLESMLYPWGNDLTPDGRHLCNIWQGHFPHHNSAEDGHLGTAPARSYEPNGFGLFNMVGNTWEWTQGDWRGPSSQLKAMRGGSFLCHESYCNRYRITARTGNMPNSTSSNLSFRCVSDD